MDSSALMDVTHTELLRSGIRPVAVEIRVFDDDVGGGSCGICVSEAAPATPRVISGCCNDRLNSRIVGRNKTPKCFQTGGGRKMADAPNNPSTEVVRIPVGAIPCAERNHCVVSKNYRWHFVPDWSGVGSSGNRGDPWGWHERSWPICRSGRDRVRHRLGPGRVGRSHTEGSGTPIEPLALGGTHQEAL
jgi:hypothetical protein